MIAFLANVGVFFKALFAVSLRFMDDYDKIGAGDYELSSSMKPSEILKAMIRKEEDGQ